MVHLERYHWKGTAQRVFNELTKEKRPATNFGTQILRRNFAQHKMELWYRGKICQDLSAERFMEAVALIMNTSTDSLKNNYLTLGSTAAMDHTYRVRKAMRMKSAAHISTSRPRRKGSGDGSDSDRQEEDDSGFWEDYPPPLSQTSTGSSPEHSLTDCPRSWRE